jgi:hypothetical protein
MCCAVESSAVCVSKMNRQGEYCNAARSSFINNSIASSSAAAKDDEFESDNEEDHQVDYSGRHLIEDVDDVVVNDLCCVAGRNELAIVTTNRRSAYQPCMYFLVRNRLTLVAFVYLCIVLTLTSVIVFYVAMMLMAARLTSTQSTFAAAVTAVSSVATSTSNIIGCDEIQVDDIWTAGYPKLMTESALRLLDVNDDGVLDVLIGFATGHYMNGTSYFLRITLIRHK